MKLRDIIFQVTQSLVIDKHLSKFPELDYEIELVDSDGNGLELSSKKPAFVITGWKVQLFVDGVFKGDAED